MIRLHAGQIPAVPIVQHGGQESTILSVHITLLHHGMVIAGLPYSFEGQNRVDEITGCSPCSASSCAGNDASRQRRQTCRPAPVSRGVRGRDGKKTGFALTPEISLPPVPTIPAGTLC